MATNEGKNHLEVLVVGGSIIKHISEEILLMWEVMTWILDSSYGQLACSFEA